MKQNVESEQNVASKNVSLLIITQIIMTNSRYSSYLVCKLWMRLRILCRISLSDFCSRIR